MYEVRLSEDGWADAWLGNSPVKSALATIVSTALVVGAICFGSPGARAEEPAAETMTITAPWTRTTPPRAQSAGGYLTVENSSAEPDRLVGASSPIAGRVEIHEMRMADGAMLMRPMEKGVELPAGGSITLAPGGLHLMLMGLNNPLAEGTTVPVTLIFERAGEVEISLTVLGLGARGPRGDDRTDDGKSQTAP